MAKWKELTTDVVTTTGVDPRVRMKEVRAEVAAYLKGDNPKGLAHLGELPDSMEDARRVIIATQDLLDTEREKHRKATLHICELVHLLDQMNEYQTMQFEMISQQSGQVEAMKDRLLRQEHEINSLAKRGDTFRQQRDAVLTTMQLQTNMAPPAPMTMGVDMGSSNAAEPARRQKPDFQQLLKDLAYNGGTMTGRIR